MQNQIQNGTNIKKTNRSKVFHYLYKHGSQSKQDIAYALKISIPTVAQAVSDLQVQGLIDDAGMFGSTGGRKAQAVVFNPKVRYAIGLDVTRNHVAIVMIDLAENVIKSTRIKCPFQNLKSYYKNIGTIIEEMVSETGVEREKILGVGIAVPAIVSENREHMTYSPVLGMKKGDLESFADNINYPCVLWNDANAAGYAETWNIGEMDDMVYLSLNNSVGGCVVLNNRVSYGKNQRCGEFGHMTIVPGGRQCYCGQIGCLDAYCNAKILSDTTNGNLKQFFSEVHRGSEVHTAIWNEYLEHLVRGVNNLRMAFDCDVVIGGYVGAFMDTHISRLRKMAALINTFEKDGSYLKVCRYKSEATAVGAALYYVDAFLNSI